VDPSKSARRTGYSSVAFTYDRYGHRFPEVDVGAVAKLETLRNFGLQTGTNVY
jgi:hypothetical protein